MEEGSYIDVDPGMKLHYITLCYNMFLIFSIYYQNHIIGLCLSIVVHAYRGILNWKRVEMDGSGGVRSDVVLLDI